MAVRIAGVMIPNEKRIEIALTYVYGVGRPMSKKILEKAKVDPNTRVKDLKEEDINHLRALLEKDMKVEGDLRREVGANIKRLRDIGTYRGTRHAKRLPVRGQRTKTNSRSIRGNVRNTATSGKKMAAQKT